MWSCELILNSHLTDWKSPGPKVIKKISSSAQLGMKFQLLIDVEVVEIDGKFRFSTQLLAIYPAH